jgi:hypothetical protein
MDNKIEDLQNRVSLLRKRFRESDMAEIYIGKNKSIIDVLNNINKVGTSSRNNDRAAVLVQNSNQRGSDKRREIQNAKKKKSPKNGIQKPCMPLPAVNLLTIGEYPASSLGHSSQQVLAAGSNHNLINNNLYNIKNEIAGSNSSSMPTSAHKPPVTSNTSNSTNLNTSKPTNNSSESKSKEKEVIKPISLPPSLPNDIEMSTTNQIPINISTKEKEETKNIDDLFGDTDNNNIFDTELPIDIMRATDQEDENISNERGMRKDTGYTKGADIVSNPSLELQIKQEDIPLSVERVEALEKFEQTQQASSTKITILNTFSNSFAEGNAIPVMAGANPTVNNKIRVMNPNSAQSSNKQFTSTNIQGKYNNSSSSVKPPGTTTSFTKKNSKIIDDDDEDDSSNNLKQGDKNTPPYIQDNLSGKGSNENPTSTTQSNKIKIPFIHVTPPGKDEVNIKTSASGGVLQSIQSLQGQKRPEGSSTVNNFKSSEQGQNRGDIIEIEKKKIAPISKTIENITKANTILEGKKPTQEIKSKGEEMRKKLSSSATFTNNQNPSQSQSQSQPNSSNMAKSNDKLNEIKKQINKDSNSSTKGEVKKTPNPPSHHSKASSKDLDIMSPYTTTSNVPIEKISQIQTQTQTQDQLQQQSDLIGEIKKKDIHSLLVNNFKEQIGEILKKVKENCKSMHIL